MKKQLSLLTFGLLIVLLAGTSACKKDKGTSATIGAEGGVYEFGDVRLILPKGSLDHEITIDGTFESLDNLPEHISPVSNLHRFHLSHPEAYNTHTATIEFDVPQMTTGASIFHSSDGDTWSNLKGTYDGTKISTTIPDFSKFVTGSGSYTVNFINQTLSEETFIVFQYGEDIFPDMDELDVYAWLGVDKLAAGSEQSVSWSGGYSFYYTQLAVMCMVWEEPPPANQVIPTYRNYLNEIDIVRIYPFPSYNLTLHSANQRTSSVDSLGYLILNYNHFFGLIGYTIVCSGIMMEGNPVFGVASEDQEARFSYKVSSSMYFVARYPEGFWPGLMLLNPFPNPDIFNLVPLIFPEGRYHADAIYYPEELIVTYY